MPRSRWFALVACLFPALGAARGSDLAALAARFAPVIHQDTHSDEDYITSFDFDGNWAGDDNWKNQEKFPLRAHVYWAGVETATQVYLTYAFFHPRDVLPPVERFGVSIARAVHLTDVLPRHENDLEGLMLVLDKAGGEVRPAVAETVKHKEFLKYQIDYRYQPTGIELDRQLRFEGEHPVIMIEAWGHGVEGWDGKGFKGGDGVVYRLARVAAVPKSQNDRQVGYQLVDMAETLWARRYDIGTQGTTFGEEGDCDGIRLSTGFLGRVGVDNAADPPWHWHDTHSPGVPAGANFLEPARMFMAHFRFPEGASREYFPNPYTLGSAPVAVVQAAGAAPAGGVGSEDGLLGQ